LLDAFWLALMVNRHSYSPLTGPGCGPPPGLFVMGVGVGEGVGVGLNLGGGDGDGVGEGDGP
jgi:hypothetical protein